MKKLITFMLATGLLAAYSFSLFTGPVDVLLETMIYFGFALAGIGMLYISRYFINYRSIIVRWLSIIIIPASFTVLAMIIVFLATNLFGLLNKDIEIGILYGHTSGMQMNEFDTDLFAHIIVGCFPSLVLLAIAQIVQILMIKKTLYANT